MADPFSIATGAISLADVCLKVIEHLRYIQSHFSGIEEELGTLTQDVEKLRNICVVIQDAILSTDATDDLWIQIKSTIGNCYGVATKLEQTIFKIRGKNWENLSGSKTGALKQVLRKRFREDDLRDCREKLNTYENALQLLLHVATLQDVGNSRKENKQSFRDISQDIKDFSNGLQSQIEDIQESVSSTRYDAEGLRALRELRKSVNQAAEAIRAVSSNQHFDIPQSVSSIFTGRETHLQELRQVLVPRPVRSSDHIQRRFVVHGLGGSGKTQFVSKFAQDNQDSFWGVFWIDASTPERIKQTLADIAKVAGIDKTENAVLHWLSSVDRHWLLIIDNADDPSIPLEKYFPKGNRGSILITTRNPDYIVHGNVGPKYYHFIGLEFSEATRLLLKASGKSAPWDEQCENLALAITQALGYLALAIIHAGAAIRGRLCNLKDYLQYYDRSWDRLRDSKVMEEGIATGAAPVYTTYEICFNQLEQTHALATTDAVQLMNILAFFHWDNISKDVFFRAVRNAELESQHGLNKPDEALVPESQVNSWTYQINKMAKDFVAFIAQNRGPAALPSIVRDGRHPDRAHMAEDRIRHAFRELTQRSLVIYNEHNETYTIHPIVHRWARERPKMDRSAQALWAELAGRVLSASILLPPLGATTADDTYHVSLLPHVKNVHNYRTALSRLHKARRAGTPLKSWFTSLLPVISVDTEKIRMHAKFSMIFHKCGEWKGAEFLMRKVMETLNRNLGKQHKKSRDAAMFLSKILWDLGRSDEAANLQDEVLQTCVAFFGRSHPDTLNVQIELGRTRWQQGQYTIARQLLEPVHQLLQQEAPDDENTFEAAEYLALALQKFWEKQHFEQAHRLISTAVKGFSRTKGPDHVRTLTAKSNLSRVSMFLDETHYELALSLSTEVFETRRAKLGKEHPYTLLAMVDLAIVLSARGQPEEGESLIREGLPIAERNVGRGHIGTLTGIHVLACILAQQGRYAEAEDLLTEAADAQKRISSQRGDFHPDRLGALIDLARCYYAQGKVKSALETSDEICQGFDKITVPTHPLFVRMKAVRARLAAITRGDSDPKQENITFPFIVYRPPDDDYVDPP